MLLEAAFWLAILPPLFAILVEACNPINGTSIRASAALDLTADFGGLSRDDFDALLGVIEQSGAAIGEASGLAPTLIASIISGIAVLHEVSSPYWPIVVYVLIFIILAIFPLWLMSGLTYAQISARNASIPTPWRTIRIPLKRTKVISLTIYAANFVLIFFAILVFSTNETRAISGSASARPRAPTVERQQQSLRIGARRKNCCFAGRSLQGQIAAKAAGSPGLKSRSASDRAASIGGGSRTPRLAADFRSASCGPALIRVRSTAVQAPRRVPPFADSSNRRVTAQALAGF